MTDAQTASSGTQLGVLDVALICSRNRPDCITRTELASASPSVARSVPLIVGALLFTQRQLRSMNDPARLDAVAAIEAACTASREQRLDPPMPLPNSRTVATYRIVVAASGVFRAEVDQKLDGILADQAGAMASVALAKELLTVLPDPYRAFYRELLQAALVFWRARRPPLGESSWHWATALRRLDYLVREGGASAQAPVVCPSCQALRPADYACLHCGAATSGDVTGPFDRPSPAPLAPPAPPATPTEDVRETFRPAAPPATPDAPAPTYSVREDPVVEQSPPAAAEPPLAAPSTPPLVTTFAADVVPAQDLAAAEAERPVDERLTWPLARLPRRLGSAVVDLVIAAVLGVVAGFGATTIAMATGGLDPAAGGQSFFSSIVLIVGLLYFVLGWATNETLGMRLFRLRLLQKSNRQPGGIVRAIGRVVGYLIVLAIGVAIVSAGRFVDALIPALVGTVEDVYLVIIGLIALYVMWTLTGQKVLTGQDRQTLGDQIGKVVVTLKK